MILQETEDISVPVHATGSYEVGGCELIRACTQLFSENTMVGPDVLCYRRRHSSLPGPSRGAMFLVEHCSVTKKTKIRINKMLNKN